MNKYEWFLLIVALSSNNKLSKRSDWWGMYEVSL